MPRLTDHPRALIVAVGDPRGGLAKVAERTAEGMGAHGVAHVYCADLSSDTIYGICGAVQALRRAARGYDAVVIQVSPHHWSRGSALHRAVCVVAVHLVILGRGIAVMHDVPSGPLSLSRVYDRFLTVIHRVLARRTVFLSESERSRAGLAGKGRRVSVVPLYVEPRSIAPPGRLDPLNLRLGVVGFIHARKSPYFALEVLRELPGATLTFLGGPLPGNDDFAQRLDAHIAELGLEDRATITGYLSEPEMDERLGSVDVGLCCYEDAATSGSVMTLFSARRPIVASDLPIFREYHTMAPGAVRLVPMSPKAAAEAALAFARGVPTWDSDLAALAERCSVSSFGQVLWELL
jgi:glycosyltransferase involved in cell wall biosynthesis